MDKQSESPYLKQAKIGRRKLRQGSLIIIVTMVFVAFFSLYFVMTAKPEIRQFAISPPFYAFIFICSIPILALGIHWMIQGYRMETKGYLDDLKQTEKQLQEITSKVLKTK